jgi:Bacterial archaeo-eukaryotic release factor family 7
MTTFTRTDLRFLAAAQPGWCATIHMPTHRAGKDTEQDPIRLKNLLSEVESQLVAVDLRGPTAKAILEPAGHLLADAMFWRYQADGLALFLAEGIFKYYRVPLRLDPLAMVARRFHLASLLRLFTGDGRFFVLALSQNAVRVLEGTRYGIDELSPEDLPQSLAEALPFEDRERQLQFRTGAPQAGGERAALFHGHGAGAEVEKDRLLRFCRKVDVGLRDLLREETAPLVLAAVDYLHPIYREANTYPHLMEDRIPGNPESLSADDLHRHAWEIVEPRFLEALNEAVTGYARLAGTGRTSLDVAEIMLAAYDGRVETLFVAGAPVWGQFDEATRQVRFSDAQAPGDDDLTGRAAIQALLRGAVVFAVEPARMPVDAPLAAVFRY